jgi:hypothetical protein
MNAATTWLAERTASLLPQTADTAAGCSCNFFYWSYCHNHELFDCTSCPPCNSGSCFGTGSRC